MNLPQQLGGAGNAHRHAKIAYQEETMMRGMNFVNYSGTATYTFRNEETFPVTIAFPPICCYTYSIRKVWPGDSDVPL